MSSGVVRVGDTVRRPLSSPAIHAALLHLESVGFDHAPRFLGIDEQEREVLSFVPGDNVWDSQHQLVRSPHGVRVIATTLRDMHDALASFKAPADAAWPNFMPDPVGGKQLVHGDIGPWNLVAEPGVMRCTIIDWDTLAPGRRVWDVAYALHTVAYLWDDPVPSRLEPFTLEETAARVRAFGDGYGLTDDELWHGLDLAAERCRRLAEMIDTRAALGQEAWELMQNEGHADAWRRGAEAAARKAGLLRELL